MTLEERFWAKVDKGGPVMVEELGNCWVWTGNKRTGYGMIRDDHDGPMRSAHRLSWAWANGCDYPERNHIIRHRCDNPPCVRPDHLEDGTHLDNNHDKLQRDRLTHSVLTNELVALARDQARSGMSLHEIIKGMPEGTTVHALAMAVRGESFPYAQSEPVAEPSFFRKQYQKLSDKEYLEIYEQLQNPWRGQGNFLARKYGVHKSLISRIKTGRFRPASLSDAQST